MQLHKVFSKLNNPKVQLFLVLLLAFYLRFAGLGYSTFYGDETKTFYLDKTVPAHEFLLNQRKGPIQFGAVWFMEKVIGGYDEFWTRVPFALAGSISVLAFYLIIQKLFSDRVALYSTILFAFNGFYIAFSRTIQYQSFLLLFGLFSVYFTLLYYEEESESRLHYLVLSGIFLGLAYLSHYDAVFFDLVVGFILVKKLLENKSRWKEMLKYMALPAAILVGIFYIPYVIYGFMSENTISYVSNRVTGFNYGDNSSWYTFWVYNPHYVWLVLALFLLPSMFKISSWKDHLMRFWFMVPFVTFEFIFSNPGTHIHNYVLPLFVLIALGIEDLIGFFNKKFPRQVVQAVILTSFSALFITALYVFIPKINNGYPWKESKIGLASRKKVNKRYHLFLYGFPYERGWKQIAEYINQRGGIDKIYTSDNDTIAEYYLRGIDYTLPGNNYYPPFYIEVDDNQEFITSDEIFKEGEIVRYEIEKEFMVEGENVARLFWYTR